MFLVSRNVNNILIWSWNNSTPKEMARGIKHIWESKMGSYSSAIIIQDVDLALKIVYRANWASVEGLGDRNRHIRKLVGEGESVSWGITRTKGKGRECELTKHMFLHSDLLKLCLKKKHNITDFFPDTTIFTIRKLALQVNRVKI